MLEWKESILLDADIDKVWALFELENLPKIMPDVVSTIPIEIKEGVVGSSYKQVYREGKRNMEYVVTDLAHEDREDYKYNRSGFSLVNLFEIEVAYELQAIDGNQTRFTYSGQNRGKNILGKALLLLTPKSQNQNVVDEFMVRVKRVAEA
ncbi:SRPBCC family protein [Streptococcus suis]|uniref:SRPBCC family protein n=1 Tax=Streptococcus suis TaxID=1307 RepID=UPI00241267ED|nr:SRPBCC family protein [Streptococcus suis]MDG4506477.1 SRPBCC family protein [Streptococcus suis]HEM2826607.1 SRPBCC family protein [Streptococcus suis]HEM4402994.1 SRPBCC family protein [Streptococcus suis]